MPLTVPPQPGVTQLKPYVPGKPVEEVQREYGLSDVIKLASNENPLGPSPRAIAAMQAALSGVNFYPDGASYTLTHALARYHEVTPAQVAVGNGEDGLIQELCLSFLDEESEVIVSRSSFPIYDTYTHIMRARLIKTPLREYGLDLEAMAAAITPRTKLIFVCNPNNPTGTIVTATEVEALLARVPETALVVFDEAYIHFVDSDAYPDTLPYVREGRPNVIVLRTFSKAYGLSGVRVGYGLGAPEVITLLNTVKEPFAVNALAQAAAVAALEDTDFVQQTLALTRAGRDYLYREFDRLGLRYLRSHTNFVLVEFGPQAPQVIQRLLERGVIVRPCAAYDLPTFARITVGTPEQNARLVKTLAEVY